MRVTSSPSVKFPDAAISFRPVQKAGSIVALVLRVPITKVLFVRSDLTFGGWLTASPSRRPAPPRFRSPPLARSRAPSVRAVRPRYGCDTRTLRQLGRHHVRAHFLLPGGSRQFARGETCAWSPIALAPARRGLLPEPVRWPRVQSDTEHAVVLGELDPLRFKRDLDRRKSCCRRQSVRSWPMERRPSVISRAGPRRGMRVPLGFEDRRSRPLRLAGRRGLVN